MSLPADRGHLVTEHRHPASTGLDTLDVRACIDLMADDHRAVPEALDAAAEALAAFIGDLVPRVRRGGRLVYAGAGTSGRLGVLDASECPPTFQSDPGQVIGLIAGGDAALRQSSERREDDPDGAAADLETVRLTAADTLLGIAAGGTTPYVLGAVVQAHAAGSMTGLLTCAAPARTPPGCDHLIVLATGPELLTGSTRLKAGSATKLALNIITTTLFVQLGKVHCNLMVDVRATNDKLTDRSIRILRDLCAPLDRDAAARLLDAAGGELKCAIVMHAQSADADAARRMLADTNGRLRPLL